MAERVTYGISASLHATSTKRLKQFRDTFSQRKEVLRKRKERYSRQFYISRNLPIPDTFDAEEVSLQEGERQEEEEDVNHLDQSTHYSDNQTCLTPGPVRWGYKNILAASIAFMFVFSAFVGLQNLQSSLNRTLGITSLALIYVFFLLVGFLTPGIVRLLRSKYSLFFGFLCHVLYILTNFYPDFFTLVPSSIILGIGSGPLWAGISTHLASIAVIVAPNTKETFDILISKYTGLFFFIFQLTQILGNLVSSLILYPYDSNPTLEIDDGMNETCTNMEVQSLSAKQKYVLLSIYLAFEITGIVILLILVDYLPQDSPPDKMTSRIKTYCFKPFMDLIKLLLSRDMLLLGPLSLYNGMELSFAYSSYTLNVISDCVGVSKVGFALMVLGFFSAAMSIIYGKAVKYIPRLVMGSLATFINLFFLLFLQFYPLRPNFILIFLFAIFWGVADGIWNTLTASLVGVLFSNNQEAGFSAFRIWMSLGFAIGFVITEVKVLSHRLWVMLAVLVVAYASYCVLEFLTMKRITQNCGKKQISTAIN